jgi:hypothetical protein
MNAYDNYDVTSVIFSFLTNKNNLLFLLTPHSGY